MDFQQKIPNQVAFLVIVFFGLIIAIATSYIGSGIVHDISDGSLGVTSIDKIISE